MKRYLKSSNYMRIVFIVTVLSAFFASSASAQNKQLNLQGTIQDSYLKTGLFDCKVSLMRADSTIVTCRPQVMEIGPDSTSVTTIYTIKTTLPTGKYLIHVTKDGYSDGWGSVIIPENYADGQKIQIPVIEIEKRTRTIGLRAAVVKATRIKVKMRGDTLIYEATAFNLPQGSMLENLIEQLPGARLTKEGEIFINGRKIDELTLSSKSLFRSDKSVLLKNLPYFTVKELKVFERPSLQSVLTGTKDMKPDFVMDVNLKNEYAYGLIANCDLGGGTHERYLAKLFGILLTRPVTVCMFGNLNNINDSKRAGINSGWNESQGYILDNANKPSVRKSAGLSVSYQSQEKVAAGYPKVSFLADINFDRYDNTNEARIYSERFLQSGTAYSRSKSDTENRITSWQSKGDFFQLGWGLTGNYHIGYKEDNAQGRTSFTQWDLERTTATQFSETSDRTKEYGLNWLHLSLIPGYKQLQLQLDTKWIRTESDVFSRMVSDMGMDGEDFRHEYGEKSHTTYNIQPTLTYDQKLWSNLHLALSDRYNISHDKGIDNLFVLSDLDGWHLADSAAIDLVPSSREMLLRVYDPVNSAYSRLRQQENEFTPTLRWNKNDALPIDISLSLPLYLLKERLDFRRDVIDTLAHRNMFVLNPSLRLKHKNWSAQIGMQSTTPGLKYLMPYRDSRNPLNIVESNSALKNNRRMNTRMTWKHKLRRNEQMKTGTSPAELTSEFIYYLNSVAQGFTYNAQTGAYTYRPENVEGNWSWQTAYNLSWPIGKGQKWWVDSETSADTWHSVDYASTSGVAEAQLNKVETVNLRERLKVRYVGKDTKLSVSGDIRWRRTWGHRPAQEDISAFDYRYGLNISHQLRRWQTSFDIDACMYSRRGYASEVMNKDECVVNFSLSQPIWKGKVVMALEARDLLHQISNTAYEVNAQGLTESWYRVTPNYVMLHLKYRFNRNPKKL